MRQIIQLIGDGWAVTREGLDSIIHDNMWAERYELVADSRHAYHRLQALVTAYKLSDMEFGVAFATAERVHAALRLRAPSAYD